jgi:hypothetical protein
MEMYELLEIIVEESIPERNKPYTHCYWAGDEYYIDLISPTSGKVVGFLGSLKITVSKKIVFSISEEGPKPDKEKTYDIRKPRFLGQFKRYFKKYLLEAWERVWTNENY